eukprot:g18681.t1
MAEVNSMPLDATGRKPGWVSPQGGDLVFDVGGAPAYAQDMDELEATRSNKRALLDDAASSVSLRKGGARLPRSAQIRALETELSRAAAECDFLRNVALSADARHHSEEDRAAELEEKSEAADAALSALEAWMDRQTLSRTAQPPDKQKELSKLTTQAQIAREAATMQRAAAERERQVHLHAKREADRAERDHHANAEELVERLKREDALRIKQEAKARSDKEQEQRMRDELGRHVVDARNREFLRSRTVDGTDILDPSGRSFRVEPSQVTTIKDAAFGLGYHPRKTPAMAAAVVDLVASKPQHAGKQSTSRCGESQRRQGGRSVCWHCQGVGTGEFSRLVPRDPTEVGDGGGGAPLEDNAEADRVEAAAGARRPQKQHRQQQQMLEDLVPPEGKKSLPGAGVPFVVEGEDKAGEGPCGGGGGDGGVDVGSGGRVGGAGRALSVFEVKALQKARARQRDRMEAGEPQVAAGKTFKDRPSFVAKPERIVFKDFVVGKVHRRRVVLTNVSLTFNTLKVLDMSDEINRFFDVTYAKPGRLSAGMTCAVDIAFTPKTARVAVTNEGVIPTRFTIMTTSESSSSTPTESSYTHHVIEIDADPAGGFDHRKDGPEESTRREIGTQRDGSSKEVELLEKASAVGDAGTKYPEGKGAIEVMDDGGDLTGYGSAEIVVVFSPLIVGEFRTIKTIRFEGSQEEFQLVVEASSAPVAVFPAEALTDLRCCVFGKLYLKKIRICNRGKIAMKAVARVPPSLRGCASFSPDMGFVQPGSFFDFGLRFRPDPASLARCTQDGWGLVSAPPPPPPPLTSSSSEKNGGQGGEFQTSASGPEPGVLAGGGRKPGVLGYDSNDGGDAAAAGGEGGDEETAGAGGMIVVPLRFDVPGQALPARAVLRARLTGCNVKVGCGDVGHETEAAAVGKGGDEAVVDFGRCFVGQSVSKRVSLRSTSLLPVKFGFIGSSAEVDVQPADGFGVLLPGEERWVEATFSPVSSVSHDSTMSFRTSLGQTTTVRCRGYGVEPVVHLNHTVLSLAPACLGDTVTASVFITNVSAVEQNLEFFVPEPELSFLKVCPSVVCLLPRHGARVEVSFCPPKALPDRGYPSGDDANDDNDNKNEQERGKNEAAAGGASALPRGIGGKDSAKKDGGNAKAAGAAPAPASSALPNSKNAVAPTPSNAQAQRQPSEDKGEGIAAAEAEGGSRGEGQQSEDGLPLIPLYAGALDEGGLVDCEKAGSGGDNEVGEAEEPWSRHGRWRVPCFLKSAAAHVLGGNIAREPGGEGARGREAVLPPLALEVTTVIVERVLSVDRDRIDFGQLAVGTKAEAILRVKNAGDEEAPLEGGELNSAGPFEVVNAFRAVPARGGSHRCILQFRPERGGIISETLVLSSPSLGKSIRVRLRGEGVQPVLKMLPADGRLDMGHVLEGDTVEREVKLHNDSVFPLRYATSPFGPRPPSNVNHLEAFALVPCEGAVPPGESVSVKAVFSPERSRIWPMLGAFRIEAKDQIYVEAAPPGENPADRAAEATEDVLAPEAIEGRSPPPPTGLQSAAPPPPPIVFRFPKDDSNSGHGAAAGEGNQIGGGGVMRLVVGCLATNDPKKSSSGTFEVELSAEAKEKGYFKITPEKGTVSPGATAEVLCAFEPPPPPPRMPGPAGSKGRYLEVGQWYKTTMLVHLRGGYRPPGSSETQTVSVQLEGFETA